MWETTTSFSDISSIQTFKKQKLAEIKDHINTLRLKEDALEEDIDEYLITILSEQRVQEYLAHAQHLHQIVSQYIIHDNKSAEFSFPYHNLISRINKGLKVMLKHLSTLHTNMRSIKRVVNASAFYTTHSEFTSTVVAYIKELLSDITPYSQLDTHRESSTWLEINMIKNISLTYPQLPSDLQNWDEFQRFDQVLTQLNTSRSKKKKYPIHVRFKKVYHVISQQEESELLFDIFALLYSHHIITEDKYVRDTAFSDILNQLKSYIDTELKTQLETSISLCIEELEQLQEYIVLRNDDTIEGIPQLNVWELLPKIASYYCDGLEKKFQSEIENASDIDNISELYTEKFFICTYS